MDIKSVFTNWNENGNNYILKADSGNRWVGFNKSVIDQLQEKHKNKFNLVIWGTKSEKDYYCVPFSVVEHLFTADHMTKGEKADQGLARWTATIENHLFKMHSNSTYSANIETFYGTDKASEIISYSDIDKIYDVDYTPSKMQRLMLK